MGYGYGDDDYSSYNSFAMMDDPRFKEDPREEKETGDPNRDDVENDDRYEKMFQDRGSEARSAEEALKINRDKDADQANALELDRDSRGLEDSRLDREERDREDARKQEFTMARDYCRAVCTPDLVREYDRELSRGNLTEREYVREMRALASSRGDRF